MYEDTVVSFSHPDLDIRSKISLTQVLRLPVRVRLLADAVEAEVEAFIAVRTPTSRTRLGAVVWCATLLPARTRSADWDRRGCACAGHGVR